MVLVVARENSDRVVQLLREHQEEPIIVGELAGRGRGKDPVELEGAEGSWLMLPELGVSLPFPEVLSSLQAPRVGSRTRTVVLGGRQEVTVVRALIQMMSSPASSSELVAVASVDAGSTTLAQAAAAGLQASVLGNGRLASHDVSEDAPDEEKLARAVECSERLQRLMDESQAQQLLVLSDADTSLLTREFLECWAGNVLLVHDSLLPAFPEPRPLEAALQGGVCITGCTVCFALPPASGSTGVRHGPIIMQESTCVLPGDNVDSLHERVVTECECKVLPTALQLIADGSVGLNRKRNKLERTSSYIKDSGDEMAVEGHIDSTP